MYIVTRHNPNKDFCLYRCMNIRTPVPVSPYHPLPEKTLVTGPLLVIMVSQVVSVTVVVIEQGNASLNEVQRI
jgi:hypothetical protein